MSENSKIRTWTPEEVTRLRQMVDNYATSQDLANTFGRSVGAIRQKLFQMGLKLKPRPKPEPHEWGGVHEIKPRVEVVCEAEPALEAGEAPEPEPVESTASVPKPSGPPVPAPDPPDLPASSPIRTVKTPPPASLLDGIAERLRVVAVELVNDPKSPRGWRLFGQVQALIGILQDKEKSR